MGSNPTTLTMAPSFDEQYPRIAWWAQGGGWIELGQDDYSRSLIRVLDIGGLLWEGKEEYDTVAEAMDEAEAFLAKWAEENGY